MGNLGCFMLSQTELILSEAPELIKKEQNDMKAWD
jgi:hypothetical protein